MKILTIDTSAIVASAAIVTEERLAAEIIINQQKKHSEKLMPAIDHLLNDAEMTLGEMDAFGVVTGPGSFTGLRIGIATIKGFAQVYNKPVIGVSSLESLAMNLACSEGIICPLLDAQRAQTYTALFTMTGGKLERLTEDKVIAIEELIEILKDSSDGKVYLVGDGVPKFGETITEQIPAVVKVPRHLSMNRASSAGMIALQKLDDNEVCDYKTIAPYYLRPSYAEENKRK